MRRARARVTARREGVVPRVRTRLSKRSESMESLPPDDICGIRLAPARMARGAPGTTLDHGGRARILEERVQEVSAGLRLAPRVEAQSLIAPRDGPMPRV